MKNKEKIKPEEFSLLGMYGNKEIFEKRSKQGYTEVAHGSGEWIGDKRIVSLWIFYHPKRRFLNFVTTYEYPKFFVGTNMHGKPFESIYTEKGFEKYMVKNKIKVGKRVNLKEILDRWN
ncbi:MAG: hypothetical protein Q8P15_02190 [Nanoarchaeota archaeon]|nr:hypothetical protein [Nanoarchaeota archaeon]